MDVTEIYSRCESNRTLFGATVVELESALESAPREIHRYAIGCELRLRSKARNTARTDGMTKNRYAASMNRVPTKRELR